jgi:hypothetical protein
MRCLIPSTTPLGSLFPRKPWPGLVPATLTATAREVSTRYLSKASQDNLSPVPGLISFAKVGGMCRKSGSNIRVCVLRRDQFQSGPSGPRILHECFQNPSLVPQESESRGSIDFPLCPSSTSAQHVLIPADQSLCGKIVAAEPGPCRDIHYAALAHSASFLFRCLPLCQIFRAIIGETWDIRSRLVHRIDQEISSLPLGHTRPFPLSSYGWEDD